MQGQQRAPLRAEAAAGEIRIAGDRDVEEMEDRDAAHRDREQAGDGEVPGAVGEGGAPQAAGALDQGGQDHAGEHDVEQGAPETPGLAAWSRAKSSEEPSAETQGRQRSRSVW